MSLLMSLSVVARSQAAATFRGTITSGSGPVSGVDVWILGPDQHVQTDSSGAFTLAETAMGHQIVQLRRVGYATQRDTLTFAPGIEIRRAYTLTPVTNTLDTVRTIAGKQRYLSPRLQAFEDRRTSHSGGHFVSDSVFRANDHSTLMNILLSQLPGVTRNPNNAIVSTGASSPAGMHVDDDGCGTLWLWTRER
jgi:hypothetical protein